MLKWVNRFGYPIFFSYLCNVKQLNNKIMRYEEVRNIVNSSYPKEYRATLTNGTTKKVRLWRVGDSVFMIDKGKRKWGHEIIYFRPHDEWVKLEPFQRKERDIYSTFMKRARKAVEMLDESGLWEDIKDEIKRFLSLDEEKQREMVCDITSDFYKNFYEETYKDGKYDWVHCYQVFASFAHKRCWKSIAWHKYSRERNENDVKQAIADKRHFSRAWRNGYDNSLEVSLGEDGKLRGWYSEEFYGCGNGHYYLLFDATHAIFYEDD